MKLFVSPRQAALLTIVTLSTVAASMSSASAAADQHRVYPGSENAQAQQARSARMAPNLYCEKHENECQ